MRACLLAAALLPAAAGLAGATAWIGANEGGANITLANGDTLTGTFTNVGKLSLPAGATVFVTPTDSLAIYASTVEIYGTIDGSGRGASGGAGGPNGVGGNPGFYAAANGQGSGGSVAAQGGGGGAGYASGGKGSGASLTAGGTGYFTLVGSPVSASDSYQGSGGGGGGGSNGLTGGSGAAGGAAIYIEASSMTIAGAINASGGTASAVTDGAAGTHPGGGGGGGGGSVVLRVPGSLTVSTGARLQADGGKGASVDTVLGGTLDPGGGGGAGRILLFANSAAYGSITISTAAGAAGGKDSGFGGSVRASPNEPDSGGVGFSTFGVVAGAPSNLAVQTVNATSIAYTWSAPGSFGDAPTVGTYRVYPATDTAPFGNPDATSAGAGVTINGLAPNTTYYRFVTAYTDWGDSAPSNAVSTHTLAAVPGAAAAPFSSMSDTSLSANWTSGAGGNPSYTTYEVDRSSDPAFGVSVTTSFVVGLSSSPAGLLPNTSYYFRIRAINLDNVPSAYAATLTTATLATPPASPALGTVFVTSVSFTWAQGANPADTKYQAQVSSDNFFSIAATSTTLGASATFFSLTPGLQYYLRVFAFNREGLSTAFSTVISTTIGNVSNPTPPTDPGAPQADVRFSYDGKATFSWSPSAAAVGILDYNLIIGSTPGGNDFFDGSVAATQYAATGLSTGRTYFARVRARSNAGVYGNFSSISAGLPVFIVSQQSPFAKPINWPNPFDPSQGPTQIGVSLDAAADVKIRVFTLQGRLVHEQTFSFAAGGNQIVTWDGANDSGSRVAPGGYITLVEKHYGGHTETQRLKIAVLY